MARMIAGITGPFTGKIGTVIGFSRNGNFFMKAVSKRKRKKATEKEQLNREKFAHAQFWLKPIKEFVRAGFKNYSPTAQGFVAAKSLLLKHAFTSETSDLHIDPSRVAVSYGDLPLPQNIGVALNDKHELVFTWDAIEMRGTNNADQAMLLAYNIQQPSETVYTTTGQFRYAGTDKLKIDTTPGNIYHVYIAFVAADRSRQSVSQYLGEIII